MTGAQRQVHAPLRSMAPDAPDPRPIAPGDHVAIRACVGTFRVRGVADAHAVVEHWRTAQAAGVWPLEILTRLSPAESPADV